MSKVQENILTRRTIFRFNDKVVSNDCIETAIYEKENSEPGISFVCVEDYIQDHIFKEKLN